MTFLSCLLRKPDFSSTFRFGFSCYMLYLGQRDSYTSDGNQGVTGPGIGMLSAEYGLFYQVARVDDDI